MKKVILALVVLITLKADDVRFVDNNSSQNNLTPKRDINFQKRSTSSNASGSKNKYQYRHRYRYNKNK